jgi:transglutaminase superfamily protein
MALRKKVRSFIRLGGADRRMVAEAAWWLAVARVAVWLLPFPRIVPWLSRMPETPECDRDLVRHVRRAVTVAARNVPWSASCLPRALAAKALLARRGCGSAFHLGAGQDPDGGLALHAWLVAGGEVVVGGAGATRVKSVARFG